jgi:hypothetical protein
MNTERIPACFHTHLERFPNICIHGLLPSNNSILTVPLWRLLSHEKPAFEIVYRARRLFVFESLYLIVARLMTSIHGFLLHKIQKGFLAQRKCRGNSYKVCGNTFCWWEVTCEDGIHVCWTISYSEFSCQQMMRGLHECVCMTVCVRARASNGMEATHIYGQLGVPEIHSGGTFYRI